MRRRYATLALLVSLSASAQALKETGFEYRDWNVVCDNTRRCEAAGYQALSGGSAPVALLLKRDAGPATPVRAYIQLDANQGDPLTLRAGDMSVALRNQMEPLSEEGLAKLMPHLLRAESAVVTVGKTERTLSLDGMRAALLKMDELQGRVDTPGALVAKGAKPEATVPPQLAAPVLVAAPLSPRKRGDIQLFAAALRSVPKGDCDDLRGQSHHIRVARLSHGKLLVLFECSKGSYQSGFKPFVVNDKPPFKPLPALASRSDAELANADFNKGELSEFVGGRASGDCGRERRWLWTASGFQLLSHEHAPMCRGIPEGIMHPVFAAERRPAAK